MIFGVSEEKNSLQLVNKPTQVVIQANRKIKAMTQRPLSPNSEVTASVSVCAPLAPIGMPESEVPNSVNMI